MARQRSALTLFLAVLAAYAAVWGLLMAGRAWRRPVRLETTRPGFYRYEFVEIRLRARDPELRRRWRTGPPPTVTVLEEGVPVQTIGGLERLPLLWNDREATFAADWPVPWNAAPGTYQLRLEGAGELGDRLRISDFKILRREPKPIKPGLVALTLESQEPLSSMRVVAPDGAEKDWRGLLDWAQFMEADAFWMLVGDTPGLEPGEVWRSYNLPLVPEVAAECRKRGLALGVYAMSYLTTSKERLPFYEYAWDVEEGRPKLTRAISLKDPRRPSDVAKLLKGLASIPGVEFVGLDYIRNALGGYELVDEFFAEMPGVRPPPEWPELSREERMVWFHHKKVMRRDRAFVDAWQWWRAHRVGKIVRRIRDELGSDVALWAFTLTWDKGWHHGQDPVMMSDAGADADALMLYEADEAQFNVILRDLAGYLRSDDVQLVVGDIVDWPLHQRSPRGARELRRRLIQATDRVYGDGRPAAGLFVHDAQRALKGRLGPHTTGQWLEAAREAARHLRRRHAAEGRGASTVAHRRTRPAGERRDD